MRAPAGAGQKLVVAAFALWLGVGCAWLPDDLWDDPAESEKPPPVMPPPLLNCPVLTLLIDTSRQGDPEIADRARRAMGREFRTLGAQIFDTPEGAYWSLMILASQNSRRDGFILSTLLTARSGHEGRDPGMTVFSKKDKREVSRKGEGVPGVDAGTQPEPTDDERGVPTLYNGLAYGPHSSLDRQARELTRQAYLAMYPAARRMCDYDRGEREREGELDGQPPPDPELL